MNYKCYNIFFISFILTFILTPFIINFVKKRKIYQNIRTDGPQTHLQKKHTPTFGGVAIFISVLLTFILGGFYKQIFIIYLALTGFLILGFIDDYLNILHTKSLGLKARYKLIVEVILSVIIAYKIYSLTGSTEAYIPFSAIKINLGLIYYPLAIFVIMGSCNAVNLTDGLDGLCVGLLLMSFLYFFYVAKESNPNTALLTISLIGALLGFLWFNIPPAKIFMGNTGSTFLGATLGTIALLLKRELFLPLAGGVFVLETLSVIIQVISYKFLGERVFKMSPLHHHFELAGWKEEKVTLRFWIVGLLFLIISLRGS